MASQNALDIDEARRILLDHGELDNALSRNPDLPLSVLREVAQRGADDAKITLWQVHGVGE